MNNTDSILTAADHSISDSDAEARGLADIDRMLGDRPLLLEDAPPRSVARAAELCVKHVDALINVWMPQLLDVESYRDGPVGDKELRDSAALVFECMFRMIGGLPLSSDLAGVPAAMGRRRAHQGIPLHDLLLAIRLDYHVIWRALLSFSRPNEKHEVLQSAERVWAAVEHQLVVVSRSYHDTELEIARHRSDEQQRWFSRLCETNGRSMQVVASTARVLGFAPTATFLVVAAASWDSSKLHPAAKAATTAGRPAHVLKVSDGAVLVLQEASGHPSFRGSLPAGALAYVDDVDSLQGVPRAAQIAIAAATALPAGSGTPLSIDALWPSVVLGEAYTPAILLRDRVLKKLPSERPGDREVLLSTLAAYFRTGSVPATAKTEFCHRNTVLNRLGQVRDLTGLDPRVPNEAAALILALESERLSAILP